MSTDAPTRTSNSMTAPERPDLFAIRTLGELLDDLELARVANGNRIAAMERELGDSFGLDAIQAHLRATEHQAELELVRLWRKNPLAPWAKAYLGLGEKSIARLVAIVGDPAARPNVAKLWAYCGHGDPARIHKRKGMTQEELFKQGNPRAKKQVWLISEALIKAGVRKVRDDDGKVIGRQAISPQGAIYLAQREKYADALHEKACARCGPSGHPAPPGSPLSDGHKHARAMRFLGKAFLKDLWIASRQTSDDAHASPAGGES